MKDELIPLGDHVCRYCSGGKLNPDGRPGAPAFYPEGHEFVSVNWLECLKAPSQGDALLAVRDALVGKGMTLRKSGRFALLNVGYVMSEVDRIAGHKLSFTHQPIQSPPDLSHSGLFYPPVGVALIEHLAALVAGTVDPADVHPAAAA